MKGEFYNKDLLVLVFKCAYQDDKLYGERRDYLLYYYVLNDTVEIKEVAAQGRHNFPNLLRRQKVSRGGGGQEWRGFEPTFFIIAKTSFASARRFA